MTITIVTVGAKPKAEITILVQSFSKRLPKSIELHWSYLKHGNGDRTSSLKHETESILRAIPKKNKIVLLDESGKQLSSPELSKSLFATSSDVTFIIGGAYGVSSRIKDAADEIWSLGKLVYPHQIVRLLLTEQIYRAHCINVNHPYHHS